MSAARGAHESSVFVHDNVLRNYLLGSEGWPSVLLGLGLPLIEGSADWGLEEGHSADRVVEGGHFRGIESVKQVDVWGFKQELGLGESQVSGVATNWLCDRHVWGLTAKGALSVIDAEVESVLDAVLAHVVVWRWSDVWLSWLTELRSLWRESHLFDLQMDLSKSSFTPDLNSFDVFQELWVETNWFVISAIFGVITGGWVPVIAEIFKRDSDLLEFIGVTLRYWEFGLVASTTERDRATACAGVRRGHGTTCKSDSESFVLRGLRSHSKDKITVNIGWDIFEFSVSGSLDEARCWEGWDIDDLAIEDSVSLSKGPGASALSAHNRIIHFNEFEGGALGTIESNKDIIGFGVGQKESCSKWVLHDCNERFKKIFNNC